MNAEELAMYEMIHGASSNRRIGRYSAEKLSKAVTKLPAFKDWPYKDWIEKDDLPDATGIYIVRSGYRPIYVGCSDVSIKKRFKQHNKKVAFRAFEDLQVAYWAVALERNELFLMETILIRFLDPCLNGVDL